MSSRSDTQKDKRKTKRYRRNSRAILLLLLISVTGLGMLTGMLYAEYEKTESWQGSDLDQELASIPPEFAQNTYDLGVLDDISILGQSAEILSVIDEHAGLTEETIADAEDVAKTTDALLSANGIESGDSVQKLERLQLYIRIYHIERTIHDTLDTEALAHVMTAIQQRVRYEENEADTQALIRLQGIVGELSALNTFVDTFRESLGDIVENVLIVPDTMTREQTDTILAHIEEQSLSKFTVIQALRKVMTSPTWNRILVNNSILSDIDRWDNEWATYQTLNKNQYRRIGVHTTLNDIEQMEWITVQGVSPRPLQTVLGHSVVKELTVNDTPVQYGQYVRVGLPVIAHVEPVYQSTNLPEESAPPTFTETPDYSALEDNLGSLLDKRDEAREQERLEAERLEAERLESERLEQERRESERLETEREEQSQSEVDVPDDGNNDETEATTDENP